KTRSGATCDRFFDPTVHVAGAVRKSRIGFNLDESGEWTNTKIEMQKQEGVEPLPAVIEKEEKLEADSVPTAATPAISLGVMVTDHLREAPPTVEWVDQNLVTR
ncbi:hypothetical protein Pmar_PMAR025232, partial [Perkinsus marinus ATCC 50983]